MKKIIITILFVFTLSFFSAGCIFGSDSNNETPPPQKYSIEYQTTTIDGIKGVKVTKINIDKTVLEQDSQFLNVTIPNEVKGFKVISIKNGVFYGLDCISSVTLPNSIIEIGDSAFYNCGFLQTINMPSSLKYIGMQAFMDTNLEGELVIPSSVKSIGSNAFSKTEITKVTIPSTIKEIGYQVFSDCAKLQYNTYANSKYLGNEENPYYLLYTPYFSNGFIIHKDTVILENISQSNVFDDYFDRHYSTVEEIIIPDKVEYIGTNFFQSLENLKTIKLGKAVKTIASEAFREARNLTNVYLNEGIVELAPSLFRDSEKLNVYYNGSIDNYVKISKIGTLAYPEETAIYTKVNGEYKQVESVVFDADVNANLFVGCTSLKSVEFTNNVTAINENAFYNCVNLKEAIMPNTIVKLGDSAFMGCKGLQKVVISNGIKTISKNCFRNCENLEEIELPNAVERIESDAFGFTKITSLDFPISLTYLGDHSFGWCKSLESVDIKANVNYLGYQVFAGCENLKTLNIANENVKVESNIIDFQNLTLNEYKNAKYLGAGTNPYWFLVDFINKDIAVEIHKDVKYIRYGAFDEYVQEITFEEDCNLLEISEGAFKGYLGSSLIIPESIKTIRHGAFAYSNIKNMILPNSVKIIEDFAFGGCNELANLVLPSSVEFIGDSLVTQNIFSYDPFSMIFEKYEGGLYIGNSENPYFYLYKLEQPYTENTVFHKDLKFIGSESITVESDCEIILPEGVVSISGYAITAGIEVENCKINLPSTLKYIGYYAFDVPTMEVITIPNGVEVILPGLLDGGGVVVLGSGVKKLFGGIRCDKLFYCGTEQEFNEILKADYYNYYEEEINEIYFYSQTKPTQDGKYWHYDIDGTSVKVWSFADVYGE